MTKNLHSKLIIIVIFLSILSCQSRETSPRKIQRTTTETLLTADWKTFVLPNSNIEMSIPFELKGKYIPIPDAAKSKVRSMKTQEYKLGKDFTILCGVTELTFEATNLEGAASEAMANLERQRQISNVEFNESNLVIQGHEAKMQSGTYTDSSVKLEFDNIMFTDGNKLGSIIVTNRASNDNGRQLREKIVNSIIND